jgi:bacterioferritin
VAQPVKKATTAAEIIDLLQDDMRGEHAAIVQYLQHAYKLGEGEVPTEIEGIARDEMRHFRWLGEKIVQLGGDPSMQRDPIYLDLDVDSPRTDLLILDVDAEERAIVQYREHIEAIDRPDVKLVLQRILKDELTHQQKFRGFVSEMGGDPNKQLPNADTGPWNRNPAAEQQRDQSLELDKDGQSHPVDAAQAERNDHPLVKMLNQRIREEYATVLLYLHQAFLSKNMQLKSTLMEDVAVWHMTHLGTLSEAIAEKERPELELAPEQIKTLLQSEGGEDSNFLEKAVRREQNFAANSEQLLSTVKASEQASKGEGEDDEDEETEALELELSRIIVHDQFQAAELANLRQGHEAI